MNSTKAIEFLDARRNEDGTITLTPAEVRALLALLGGF